jgi:glycosyltransferase involved in cell wall biosynthesis
MKLGVFNNFRLTHCGGSETVLHNVVTELLFEYGYEFNIYTYNENVNIMTELLARWKCKKGNELIAQINQNDHIWVYSDSFWGWDTIVKNIEKIDCGVSVCLVGAYNMRSHPSLAQQFIKHKDRYNIITHSKGEDHKWASENGLDVTVIPNGVMLGEFEPDCYEYRQNFRKKYNIKEKYVILNVSNFFYGKGHLYLADICEKIAGELDDFILVQVSSTIDYPYGERFRDRCIKECKKRKFKSLFLKDISREDVIGAFLESDVFLFPSQKEVAPLVILESRVAKLPWVAMEVGNMREQSGGVALPITEFDKKGYAIIKKRDINHFSFAVRNLITNFRNLRGRVIEDGQKDIDKLDWKNIVPLYDKVFKS